MHMPEMVHIHVGPDKDKFVVQKHLLLEASQVSSLRSKQKTARRERLVLSISQMGTHIHSASRSTGSIRVWGRSSRVWIDEHPSGSTYLKLWILGDKQGMDSLKRFVMKQLHARRTEADYSFFEEVMDSVVKEEALGGLDLASKQDKLVGWILDMCFHQPAFSDLLEDHGADAFDHDILFQVAFNSGQCEHCAESNSTCRENPTMTLAITCKQNAMMEARREMAYSKQIIIQFGSVHFDESRISEGVVDGRRPQ